jgi:hypothetical protein
MVQNMLYGSKCPEIKEDFLSQAAFPIATLMNLPGLLAIIANAGRHISLAG